VTIRLGQAETTVVAMFIFLSASHSAYSTSITVKLPFVNVIIQPAYSAEVSRTKDYSAILTIGLNRASVFGKICGGYKLIIFFLYSLSSSLLLAFVIISFPLLLNPLHIRHSFRSLSLPPFLFLTPLFAIPRIAFQAFHLFNLLPV